MKKIIQICTPTASRDHQVVLYALCEDGSLWCLLRSGEYPEWFKMEYKIANDQNSEA